jgi:ribose 5-phosphate isomerase B
MHVILGADHGGFLMKEEIKQWLVERGDLVIDVGATSLVEDDDYVDYAKKAINEATSSEDRIVLFCRNGYGMVIAANRFVGVRCGLAFDEGAVQKGRTDDDINSLAIPADYVEKEAVERMIDIFLTEKFSEGEKYKRRVIKLDNLIS